MDYLCPGEHFDPYWSLLKTQRFSLFFYTRPIKICERFLKSLGLFTNYLLFPYHDNPFPSKHQLYLLLLVNALGQCHCKLCILACLTHSDYFNLSNTRSLIAKKITSIAKFIYLSWSWHPLKLKKIKSEVCMATTNM